jgi:magnesium-transporting ATPase (P-type)
MIKRIFNSLASATRVLLRDWRVLVVLFVLYLAMFGAGYQFLRTLEATSGQLLLSAVLALAVPVLFLVIQTMAARHNHENQQPAASLVSALRDFWKLLVIAIPLILITLLASYLFSKAGSNASVTAVRQVAHSVPGTPRPSAPKSQPVGWQTVAINTLEYLVFFLILPLATIHLWIATAREGLNRAFKRSARILARAFAPQAVVTYAIGFVFFAVVPHFLVVTKTPAGTAWLDAGLLVVRLLLAVAFSLIGWVATVGALGELSDAKGAINIAQTNEGPGHVPAEA